MRRITVWISATIALVAVLITYQANLDATGGRADGDRGGACGPAAVGAPAAVTTPAVVATLAAVGDNTVAAGGACDHAGHQEKPGERK